MKVRFPTRCERCKRIMGTGTQAVRIYGRLWHIDCVMAYREGRRAMMAA